MGSNPGYSPSELLRHRNRREKTLLIALITLNYRKTTLIYIAEKKDSISYPRAAAAMRNIIVRDDF